MRSSRAWARSSNCKLLDAEQHVEMMLYLPLGMQRTLRMCTWMHGGSEEGGEEEGESEVLRSR